MSRITDITAQRRNKKRRNIFLDGEYAFSLHEDLVKRFEIAIGGELFDEDIERLRQKDAEKHALELCASYLTHSAKSEREISDYLAKKGVEETTAAYALQKLRQLGYVDDSALAESYALSQSAAGRLGSRAVCRKLIEKGVRRETAERAAAEVATADSQNALTMAKKLAARYSRELPEKRRAKLYRALIYRGFQADAVRVAVDRVCGENEYED